MRDCCCSNYIGFNQKLNWIFEGAYTIDQIKISMFDEENVFEKNPLARPDKGESERVCCSSFTFYKKIMKKNSLMLFVFVSLILCNFVSAQTEDNQLIDATQENLQKYLEFHQFSSCEDMNSTLSKYADLYKDTWGGYR